MNLQTVSAATPAQQAANPDPATFAKAKQLVAKINVACSLHGDQFRKVNDACIEYFQKLNALSNATPADVIAKTQELKDTRNAKIKAVLEPGQLNSWAAFKE
jgi:sensor domain CHASE-containing protein